MSECIRFCLDGKIETVDNVDPTMNVLDWLRLRAERMGTKEGCAEGDCGSCTVVIGSLEKNDLGADRIVWRAVNACIMFLPMLDGKALITIESLGLPDSMHAIQQAMVEQHGSQCGFCTPGIVMSLYANSIQAQGTDASTEDVLAGNLCRCTGYGPILQVARTMAIAQRDDSIEQAHLRSIRRSTVLQLSYEDPLSNSLRHWFTPKSIRQLSKLLVDYPEARIVAGATDVGLWVTKKLQVIPTIIYISEIEELKQIVEQESGLELGASVTYAEAHAALARLHPDLGLLVRRIGAVQVRNVGTIGGNIANGSPIGDMPPALIALGATLHLRHGENCRAMPLEEFFLEYGKQDRRPGEFVERVDVPRPDRNDLIRIVKLSKRFDSDISAVCGAFAIRLQGRKVVRARIAFGGMAGVPKRALNCELALMGREWNAETCEQAAKAMEMDFEPLSDVRGSKDYRVLSASNLIRRLWHESMGNGGTVFDAAIEPIEVLDV